MARKVYLKVDLEITLHIEEGVEIQEVLDSLQIEPHHSMMPNVDILDYNCVDYEITDSK